MNEPNNEIQFSKPFGNTLVTLAEIDPGATVLDIGMGNGIATFFPALKKIGNHGRIIGIDISDEMVKGVFTKIKEKNIKNAFVIKTDAHNLFFKDNTFDVVISGFSYVYTTLKEVYRVLKEGGQVGITTWERLEDEELMASCIKEYIPITEGGTHCDTEKELKAQLQKAGFQNIEIISKKEVVVYRNKEYWWKEVQEGWGVHLKKIDDMGPGNLEKFKKEVFKKFLAHNQGLHVHVSALLGFGTKGR
ncbi:MAG: methyltransferase domain-containing protein [Candidatus Methanofastidiosia archaeon]|jgi:ubiquinone/menaquinone biosynthesis C-methylase UbiE